MYDLEIELLGFFGGITNNQINGKGLKITTSTLQELVMNSNGLRRV